MTMYTNTKVLILFALITKINALSFLPDSKGYYDRFRATCPADLNSIYQFNPSLVDKKSSSSNDDNGDDIWAAVYRSSNNLPSVFLKDDFLSAMDMATSTAIMGNSDSKGFAKNPKIETNKEKNDTKEGITANTPVAVARLRPVGTKWIIDSMRCTLKKEDTNTNCDGGSEHKEALSICIDELILEHLTRQIKVLKEDSESCSNGLFEEALRAKSTLVAAPLFEARGFQEVTELSLDMATHTSTLDASMERYAARVADIGNDDVVAKSPGARDRALQILSLLGQLDSGREKRAATDETSDSEEGEEYDPFAGFKKFNGTN